MAGEDKGHLDFVRRKPCAACGIYGSQAHHAGPKGYGQRVHDHLAVPLCEGCHMSYHSGGKGYFATMSKLEKRAWMMREAGRVLMDHGETILRELLGHGVPY